MSIIAEYKLFCRTAQEHPHLSPGTEWVATQITGDSVERCIAEWNLLPKHMTDWQETKCILVPVEPQPPMWRAKGIR